MPADGAEPQEVEGSRVLDSLFESYAAACRTGADVDASVDAAFEVRLGEGPCTRGWQLLFQPAVPVA